MGARSPRGEEAALRPEGSVISAHRCGALHALLGLKRWDENLGRPLSPAPLVAFQAFVVFCGGAGAVSLGVWLGHLSLLFRSRITAAPVLRLCDSQCSLLLVFVKSCSMRVRNCAGCGADGVVLRYFLSSFFSLSNEICQASEVSVFIQLKFL